MSPPPTVRASSRGLFLEDFLKPTNPLEPGEGVEGGVEEGEEERDVEGDEGGDVDDDT